MVKSRFEPAGRGQSGAIARDPWRQGHWLMVFDTQTEQFVGSAMYAVESLPAAGTLMTFDTMSAEFVGEGYQPLLIEDRLAFR